MIIQYAASFKRQYKKLPEKFQRQFNERLLIFLKNHSHLLLRVHPLKGKYAGYWSMNISGDLRAIYLIRKKNIIIFALIGSHSNLYG